MNKKSIAVAFVFAVAFGVAVTAHAQTSSTTPTTSVAVNAYIEQLKVLRTMRQGMSGDDVKLLQAVLAADPTLYPEGLITGYYGPLTSKAVRKYQAKHGLETVGNVGPKTLKKLNEFLDENPISREMGTSTSATSTVLCAKVPPGHLIAPGWLKKNGGVRPIVPECQVLPPGILKKLGTTTTATTTTGGGTGTTTATTTDTTAPVISSVAISPLATTTQIVWVTSESATTRVIFGTTSPLTASTSHAMMADVAGLSFAHVVTLTNLSTSTMYRYIIVSADAALNTATTSEQSFVTNAM
jgi:peptidoglycan hydrolase-like protein with peptidoglycan-binding domain